MLNRKSLADMAIAVVLATTGLSGNVYAAWDQFQLGAANTASTYGSITAVSRIPNSMEVWWIGPDGSVHDAYWYEGAQWSQFTLAPPPCEGF